MLLERRSGFDAHEHAVVALTQNDRERIVEVLLDPPNGLGELGGVLEAQFG